jgi:hypothetical protein
MLQHQNSNAQNFEQRKSGHSSRCEGPLGAQASEW